MKVGTLRAILRSLLYVRVKRLYVTHHLGGQRNAALESDPSARRGTISAIPAAALDAVVPHTVTALPGLAHRAIGGKRCVSPICVIDPLGKRCVHHLLHLRHWSGSFRVRVARDE